MGLFRRNSASGGEGRGRPRFGAGRILKSDQDLRTAVDTIGSVLEIHAPTKYRYMPTLHKATVIWRGDEPMPTESWCADYGEDDVFVFVFWPVATGTKIGLFPLGGSEESLQTPFIGQWKGMDPSLSSEGRFPSSQLSLLTPPVEKEYFTEILRLAQKPVTDSNLAVLAEQVNQMFSLKGYEYISRLEGDQRAAKHFVDVHPFDGDLETPQRVLEDLGERNQQLVPYLQDLPSRIRGILLEPGPDGVSTAGIWSRM